MAHSLASTRSDGGEDHKEKKQRRTSEPKLFDLFFEGPEKLLEILWLPSATSKSLRSLKQEIWTDILKLVKCTILSKTSNDEFDAYVLSESSLFVFPNKVILKTCGTTTLLCAVASIIKVARDCGLVLVDDIWYSRRNYLEPQKQMEPHGSWKREVQFLDSIAHGSSFILGSTNSIHWFIFVTDNQEVHCATKDWGPEKGPLALVSRPNVPLASSSTFEVLMGDLDPSVLKQFHNPVGEDDLTSRESKERSARLTETSGIASLIPGSSVDSFLFSPCGYSMNGLKGDKYWTIHVTPQPSCNFASFETDVSCNYAELLENIVDVFKPGMFTLSLILVNTAERSATQIAEQIWEVGQSLGLVGRYKTHLDLDNGHQLFFAAFMKASKLPRPTDDTHT